MIMLDTNICIYILKSHPDHVRQKFNEVKSVHISAVVYSELYYGIELSPMGMQAARRKQLHTFLTLVTIHPWNKKAAEQYGQVRAYLRRKGALIGNMDLLIAAHALSLDATLVTNNAREFKRIPNLKLENWYSAN